MNNGPMSRKRYQQKNYLKYLKTKPSKVCDFCEFSIHTEQVISEHNAFWITTNIFPYDMWDNQGVDDHLMLVPKRHIFGLHELDVSERDEFLTLVSTYELNGYSLYSRAPNNSSKSIPHLHTHLIKTNNKHYNFMIYASKPHINVMK